MMHEMGEGDTFGTVTDSIRKSIFFDNDSLGCDGDMIAITAATRRVHGPAHHGLAWIDRLPADGAREKGTDIKTRPICLPEQPSVSD
jgi:hypothetical protein